MNPQSLFCPNSACPATGQTAQAGHGQSQPPRCCGSDLPRGHPPSGPEGTPARGVTTRDHQLKQGLCPCPDRVGESLDPRPSPGPLSLHDLPADVYRPYRNPTGPQADRAGDDQSGRGPRQPWLSDLRELKQPSIATAAPCAAGSRRRGSTPNASHPAAPRAPAA